MDLFFHALLSQTEIGGYKWLSNTKCGKFNESLQFAIKNLKWSEMHFHLWDNTEQRSFSGFQKLRQSFHGRKFKVEESYRYSLCHRLRMSHHPGCNMQQMISHASCQETHYNELNACLRLLSASTPAVLDSAPVPLFSAHLLYLFPVVFIHIVIKSTFLIS